MLQWEPKRELKYIYISSSPWICFTRFDWTTSRKWWVGGGGLHPSTTDCRFTWTECNLHSNLGQQGLSCRSPLSLYVNSAVMHSPCPMKHILSVNTVYNVGREGPMHVFKNCDMHYVHNSCKKCGLTLLFYSATSPPVHRKLISMNRPQSLWAKAGYFSNSSIPFDALRSEILKTSGISNNVWNLWINDNKFGIYRYGFSVVIW
jgi:hypothetical protein